MDTAKVTTAEYGDTITFADGSQGVYMAVNAGGEKNAPGFATMNEQDLRNLRDAIDAIAKYRGWELS